MNTEIRELNINELDAISGAGLVSVMHDAVNYAIASAKNAVLNPVSNSEGLGGGMGGSGSGSPTCPGCHSPA